MRLDFGVNSGFKRFASGTVVALALAAGLAATPWGKRLADFDQQGPAGAARKEAPDAPASQPAAAPPAAPAAPGASG